MELKLTPRLRAVADQVAPGSRLADVGTDHAYLPVRLLMDGTINGAIAADLREWPLARARETARRFGVEDRLSFRLCDGLRGIVPEEVDTVAIAGMGGETIAGILAQAPWTKQGTRLLLQPMTSFLDLRSWLQQNGYVIESERIAQEGARLYAVLQVHGGQMEPLSPGELWAGRQSDDPLRGAYLAYMEEKLTRALAGRRASRSRDETAEEAISAALRDIRDMKKEL